MKTNPTGKPIQLATVVKSLRRYYAAYVGKTVTLDYSGGCAGSLKVSSAAHQQEGLCFYAMHNRADDVQRVEVSGYYPGDFGKQPEYYSGDKRPKITFSAHRLPEDIWRDIERSFMPDYATTWALMRDRISHRLAREQYRATRIEAVRQLLNDNGFIVSGTERIYFETTKRGLRGEVVFTSSGAEAVDRYEVKVDGLTGQSLRGLIEHLKA